MSQSVLTSQIRAALKMLRSAIEACPDALWDRKSDPNGFWALAYYTLFFAHLYALASEEDLEPFAGDVAGREGLVWIDLGDWSELEPGDTNSKDDVLACRDHIDRRVAEPVQSAPFDGPSGFHWLPLPRGAAHLCNLRHIQHHASQMAEGLRQDTGVGTNWVFADG